MIIRAFILWFAIVPLTVARIDCMGFPFGTVLGVFTLIVLTRESMQELGETDPAPGPPPLTMP